MKQSDNNANTHFVNVLRNFRNVNDINGSKRQLLKCRKKKANNKKEVEVEWVNCVHDSTGMIYEQRYNGIMRKCVSTVIMTHDTDPMN